MGTENKIKAAIAYSGKSQAKVAADIGLSPSNFSQKLKRNSFNESELKNIAISIGANIEPWSFVFKDGKKI